jgi:hypothetical protein
MAKISKCAYCKEELNENDDIIIFETGIKTKIKKKAHNSCRDTAIKRQLAKQVYSDILGEPLNQITVFILEGMYRKYPNWDFIISCIRNKEKAIKININKGIPYLNKIVTNGFEEMLKEMKNRKIKSEEKYIQPNVLDTVEYQNENNYKSQKSKFDISNII